MENKNNNRKLIKFLGKVAVGVVASTILTPPVAVFLGTYTYGTAKCMEYLVEEEDKKTCKFISYCGKDIVSGGLFNCLVGTEAVSLVSQETNLIGKEAEKEITINGITETAESLIKTGLIISKGQKKYEDWNKFKDNMNYLKASAEPINHKTHLNNGISYLESCEVCNV